MHEQIKRDFIIKIGQLQHNDNTHNLLNGSRHDYVACRIQMNPVSPFSFQINVYHPETSHYIVPSLYHYSKTLTIICIVLIYWFYTQIILNNTYRVVKLGRLLKALSFITDIILFKHLDKGAVHEPFFVLLNQMHIRFIIKDIV
jgi:hypothetical protein